MPDIALLNPLTPLFLVDAFPTQHSFDLPSSLHQVDSRQPHPFPIQPSLFLCHVYSRRFINFMTAVGQSPIMYLPHLICPSLSLLALYISVLPPVHCMFLCTSSFITLCLFSVSSSVLCLCLPLFYLSYSILPLTLLKLSCTFLTIHS